MYREEREGVRGQNPFFFIFFDFTDSRRPLFEYLIQLSLDFSNFFPSCLSVSKLKMAIYMGVQVKSYLGFETFKFS